MQLPLALLATLGAEDAMASCTNRLESCLWSPEVNISVYGRRAVTKGHPASLLGLFDEDCKKPRTLLLGQVTVLRGKLKKERF